MQSPPIASRTRCDFFILAASIALTTTNPAVAATVSEFDVLVATNTLVVLGTATIQGNAFSVGRSTFAVIAGNVGIGTDTPKGQIHALGPVVIDAPAQFLWIASSAAFRAGAVNATQWDPANIGLLSVALGYNNLAKSKYSAALSGAENNALGSGWSVISGGLSNDIGTAAEANAIGGGAANAADGFESTVAGGANNLATNDHSTVGGGAGNFAIGRWSTIPGGINNTASGEYSFAAGKQASAIHNGSFVWSDSNIGGVDTFSSSAPNEFRIRAQNGFVFHASISSPTIIVSSNSLIISTSPTAAKAVPNIYISSANGYVGIGTSTPLTRLDVDGDSAVRGQLIVTTTATIIGVDGTGYSMRLASGAYLGGCVRYGDGTQQCSANTGGGGTSNGPSWQKYTLTYSAFSKAATSSTTIVAQVSAGTVIHGIKLKHTTSFTGGSISAYTVSIGTDAVSDSNAIYASPFDVFQTTASNTFQLSNTFTAEQQNANWNVTATANSTGANLSSAAAGSLDIWILSSLAQ